jgi:hypothetical protein
MVLFGVIKLLKVKAFLFATHTLKYPNFGVFNLFFNLGVPHSILATLE